MTPHWTAPLEALKRDQQEADQTKAFVKVLSFVPELKEHQVGHATIKFFDCLVLKRVRLMRGSKGLWLSFPSRRTAANDFEDLAFLTTNEMRELVTELVKEAYEKTATQVA